MRVTKFLLFFLIFYNFSCNKCSRQKEDNLIKTEEEIIKGEEILKEEPPIWSIPDLPKIKDKKDDEEDEYVNSLAHLFDIGEIEWWEPLPFPEPNTLCSNEGMKRCLAPGNFKDGKEEFVICEKNKNNELIWKEYKCNVDEIFNCGKAKTNSQKEMCEMRKQHNS